MKITGRKALLFGVISAGYACLVAIVVVITAIRTCSMQPDVAEQCEATPVVVVFSFLGAAYLAGAIWFFRHRISGVD